MSNEQRVARGDVFGVALPNVNYAVPTVEARAFRVYTGDVAKYGSTAKCAGCTVVGREWNRPMVHFDQCRS